MRAIYARPSEQRSSLLAFSGHRINKSSSRGSLPAYLHAGKQRGICLDLLLPLTCNRPRARLLNGYGC